MVKEGEESMPEEQETSPSEVKAEEKAKEPEPQGTDWKAEARKWEKRAKANAKELEDYKASKSDDANASAVEELAKAKERIKALETEKARSQLARSIAKSSGVDPDILLRMSGDTEEEIKENAELLAKSSKAKWPTVPDDGSPKGSQKMTKEQILAIKNPVEQLRAAARNLDAFK